MFIELTEKVSDKRTLVNTELVLSFQDDVNGGSLARVALFKLLGTAVLTPQPGFADMHFKESLLTVQNKLLDAALLRL